MSKKLLKNIFRSRSHSTATNEYLINKKDVDKTIHHLYIGIIVNRFEESEYSFYCTINITGVARQRTSTKTNSYPSNRLSRSLYYFRVNSMVSVSVDYILDNKILDYSIFKILEDNIKIQSVFIQEKSYENFGTISVSLYYDYNEVLTSDVYNPIYPSIAYLNIIEASHVPSLLILAFEQIEKRGINQQGIYRLNCSQNETIILLKQINSGNYDMEEVLKKTDIYAICCLVKTFFRKLNPPLINNRCYELMAEYKDNVNEILSVISGPNKITLIALIEHLKKIDLHSSQTRMDLYNLSVIFAPNLFQHAPYKTSIDCSDIMNINFNNQINVLESFIKKYKMSNELSTL